MQRKRILISGKVIGIFFRAYIKQLAKKLNLKGIVRNLPDQKVEVIVEGEEDKIKQLIDFCKKGPDNAKVENIKIIDEKPENKFKDFEIVY